jgi:hypothetical protein
MKKLLSLTALSVALLLSTSSHAQDDKAKRPSPAASVSQTLPSGATISVNYSQPSLKGRTMGKDVEPMAGKVWRAGANEATVFETDKDVMIEGKTLPAGKYALFMVANDDAWTVIFNKVHKTWGAYDYEKNKEQDALQISVKPSTADTTKEQLTYTIDDSGKVSLWWGTTAVDFTVK